MPFNQFHFGYPQEVDDIHKKNLPLMVVNPPSSIASTNEIQLDQNVLTNTSFVLQIYDHFPSSMTGQPSINKADNFDNLEKCFYYWLENTIDAHGTKVQLSAGSLRIERSTTSSNDNYSSQWGSIKYITDVTRSDIKDRYRYAFASTQLLMRHDCQK